MTLDGTAIFTKTYAANPYETLRELRERGSVARIERPDGWLVTSHAAAASVLVDDEHFAVDPSVATSTGLGASVVAHRTRSPLGSTALLGASGGDTHRRLRRIVAPYFGSGPLGAHREAIEELIDGSVEATKGGQIELAMDVIRPTVERAVETLIGIDARDRRLWASARKLMAAHSGAEVDATSDYRALRRHLERGLAAGRDGSLLSDLGGAFVDGALDESEAVALVAFILNAGVSPTTLAVGNALNAFATQPDQLAALRADPALASRAADEVLRFDSPTQVLLRYVARDIELGGESLAAGDTVFVMVGAAHHDPAEFEDPESFNLARPLQGHQILSFGRGPHFCLGAPLARVIIARFIRLLVIPDAFPRSIIKWERGGDFLTRGFQRMIMRRSK
jgi:cytochrome P450